MSEKQMKSFMIKTVIGVICMIAIVAIAVRVGDKNGVQASKVNDATTEQKSTEDMTEASTQLEEVTWEDSDFDEIDAPMITIKKPEGIKKKDIMLEDCYMQNMLKIVLPAGNKKFYDQNPCEHNIKKIENIVYEEGEQTEIKITFNKICAFWAKTDEENIYIKVADPRKKYDKIVVVDVGHGGKDPGSSYGELIESQINLNIALKLKEIMDAQTEIKVYYTRTTDVYPTWPQRVDLANNLQADLFLSLHSNYLEPEKGSASGVEVMYDQYVTEGEFISKTFAEICQAELVEATGLRDRGLKDGHSIYIIRNSEVPVALLEMGFLSDENDAAILTDPKKQEEIAQSIYKMFTKAYEVMKK